MLAFVGSVLIVNGIPHFVRGISGDRHMTPFARRSSAVTNVLWGLFNLGVGAWTTAGVAAWASSTLIAAGLGTAVTAVSLAWFWSDDTRRLPWHEPSGPPEE